MENLIEVKSPIFSRYSLACLTLIGLAGFLIRFFYFPEGVPITLDGYTAFWYANDLSISGTFPDSYPLNFPNNGWPTFLSVFFHFSNCVKFSEEDIYSKIIGRPSEDLPISSIKTRSEFLASWR